MNTKFKTLALAAIAAFSLNLVNAATITWTGASNSAWSTNGNWSSNSVPTSSDDVIIPSGTLSNLPALSANTTLQSLTLNGNSIDLSGKTLSIGTLNFLGGHFTNSSIASVISAVNTVLNFSGATTIPTNVEYISTNTTFTNGVINAVKFSIPDGGTVTGMKNASHVNGLVSKTGKASFVFPVGDGKYYAPFAISNPSGNQTQVWTVVYSNTTYSNTTPGTGIQIVSKEEFWTVTRTGGSGNAWIQLSYDIDRSGAIYSSADLVVANYSVATSTWNSLGNGSFTGTTSGTVLSNNAVTGNSAGWSSTVFTLASTTTLNPLPIKLLSFTAEKNNNQVDVKWTTISEDNNDFFTVEKSLDGKNWMEIGILEAAGNSVEMINYSYTDNNAAAGVQYYRLKQTDNNGAFTYTAAVSVNFSKTAIAQVYPNPASGSVNISLNSENGSDIRIVNTAGQVVMNMTNQFGVVSIDLTELPTGIYSVEVVSENEASNIKLVRK